MQQDDFILYSYMKGTLHCNIHFIHTLNTYHKSIIIYVLLCFQHSVVPNQLKRTCFHVIEDNEFEFCKFSLDQHHHIQSVSSSSLLSLYELISYQVFPTPSTS